MYVIINSAIVKKIKVSGFVINQSFGFFEAFLLFEEAKLAFQVFFSDFQLIFAFPDNHGHEFGFGIFEAFFKDLILYQIWVLDVLPEEGAFDVDV